MLWKDEGRCSALGQITLPWYFWGYSASSFLPFICKIIKSSQPEPTPECTTAKEGIVNQEPEILPEINKEEIKAAPQRAKNIKVPEKDNIVIDGY